MKDTIRDLSVGLDIAIFEVVDQIDLTFIKLSGEAAWTSELIPNTSYHTPFSIEDDSPYLKDFLIDAEMIWGSHSNGKVKSGLWTEVLENRRELNLEATAIKQDDSCLLVISNGSEEFAYRQRTLQSARELMIANDKLEERHEYLHSRLLNILSKPKDSVEVFSTLSAAIENADFSVIILDEGFEPIIENSSVVELFECNDAGYQDYKKPSDIILKLLKGQVPESDRILETFSSWSGELCWMNPPQTLKWLKVALYPITQEPYGLKNWIIFIHDISGVKHLLQRNEMLTMQDMLTELPNRHAFWQTLKNKANLTAPFFLLYIDINDFRQMNEFYGHNEGDKLLVELSGRLQRELKRSDFVARVGGDEFAVILSDISDEASCQKVINRILDIADKPFVSENNNSYKVSLSIGAAGFPKDATTVEELMRFVDISAYNGRERNQNTVQFYSTELRESSTRRIKLEGELRNAIIHDQFVLLLQPILNLQCSTIVKVEALIRWHHPSNGVINPDEFIPIAEQSEIIVALGKWVIEKACEYLYELKKRGLSVKISINLSPIQIKDATLYPFIRDTLEKFDVSPGCLELEITEGVLVDDYPKVFKLLNEVKALGITVSVDDFGTGYSSLAYLKKLPLDYLKIDQSFVKDIATDESDKAIVLAVISMAHNLNLEVIAEGVETEEQRSFLLDSSCNSAQGFLFSRPVSFSEIVELLQSDKPFDVLEHKPDA